LPRTGGDYEAEGVALEAIFSSAAGALAGAFGSFPFISKLLL